MLGAVGRPIWGPFDMAWLGPARLRRVALRPGYLSWGLIMMLLSRSLRRLCSLRRLQPLVGYRAWQVPTGAPSPRMSRCSWGCTGQGLGWGCVFVVSLHNPGSVMCMCWVIPLHLFIKESWLGGLRSEPFQVIQRYLTWPEYSLKQEVIFPHVRTNNY